MIYWNNGFKRDILDGNWGAQQVGNHVFGAETIDISEITC